MTRTNAPLASDLGMSLLVGALATVLLLILSATNVSAQARMTWPRATRALLRGEVLKADDYVLADTTIVWRWKEPSADTITAVAGWVTRRPIAEGEFMHTPSIAPANAITMGSTVKILYQDGPVRLTLTGTATNNAAIGAPVGVRLDKNRRLDGIAVGPNTVRLR
ncbi:MAG: flagellar basal body P-ring formation chaperone FlgA [Gemmatimonadaceae bacterium]